MLWSFGSRFLLDSTRWLLHDRVLSLGFSVGFASRYACSSCLTTGVRSERLMGRWQPVTARYEVRYDALRLSQRRLAVRSYQGTELDADALSTSAVP